MTLAPFDRRGGPPRDGHRAGGRGHGIGGGPGGPQALFSAALGVEVEPPPSDEAFEVVSAGFLALSPAPSVLAGLPRESVRYNPEPLNTMPTGEKTLRSRPPHTVQVVRGASEIDCTTSVRSPHSVQAYSQAGLGSP